MKNITAISFLWDMPVISWKCVSYGCKSERVTVLSMLSSARAIIHLTSCPCSNLPKKHKMTKPRYQPILKDKVPSVNLPIGSTDEGEEKPMANARIIAGELNGIKGAAKTFSPVQMWDVSLPHVGSEIDIPYPADHNCIVFVRRGRVSVLTGEEGGDKTSELGPQDVALMRLDGSDMLRLRVNKADSSVLIMGGEPLNEPIRAQGPFVMNDEAGIRKAISDYQSGKF